MATRTVKAVFYSWFSKDDDGNVVRTGTAFRGQEVDLPEDATARGDELGVFDVGGPPATDAVDAAYGASDGGAETGENAPGADDDTVPSELSDAQIDQLSGQALDNACEAAGIDTDSGGSLANGGMSAAEKREALKASNAD